MLARKAKLPSGSSSQPLPKPSEAIDPSATPIHPTTNPKAGSEVTTYVDEELVKLGEFEDLVANPELLQALKTAGYCQPSPIQWKAIPLGRLGCDLVAQAKSGTGKTIVFAILVLEKCILRSHPTKGDPPRDHTGLGALILAPTREIAFQIYTVIRQLLLLLHYDESECQCFIGGTPYTEDVKKAPRCRIAIGTPGRINQLLVNGVFVTHHFKMLVLDEADKLMEDTFRDTVKDILTLLPRKERQILLFSATYDSTTMTSIEQFMNQPQYILLSHTVPTLASVHQYYQRWVPDNPSLVNPSQPVDIAQRSHQLQLWKQTQVKTILQRVSFYQCIIFINQSHKGRELVQRLTAWGYPALWISGQLQQQERLDVMQKVYDFKVRILVCSDLIARGIDVDRVDLVINWDLPRNPETYFHRVGRTGRFGTHGYAISLVSPEEYAVLQVLQNDFGAAIESLETLWKLPREHQRVNRVALREDESTAYQALLEVTPTDSTWNPASTHKNKRKRVKMHREPGVTTPSTTSPAVTNTVKSTKVGAIFPGASTPRESEKRRDPLKPIPQSAGLGYHPQATPAHWPTPNHPVMGIPLPLGGIPPLGFTNGTLSLPFPFNIHSPAQFFPDWNLAPEKTTSSVADDNAW
ncbi:hypothetical protein IWQ62_002283 [Dispira parvispora]|uniref:RNA helicase n=1 Tax=Dispira parvispora TaxID=1520584 RepID=A0A9W8E851_9FUNG|nr:hypothetical protein IWQ62_002283 [Dispira parvispora]